MQHQNTRSTKFQMSTSIIMGNTLPDFTNPTPKIDTDGDRQLEIPNPDGICYTIYLYGNADHLETWGHRFLKLAAIERDRIGKQASALAESKREIARLKAELAKVQIAQTPAGEL